MAVMFSSIVTIINGVFLSLIVSKYLGVTQFGYFKLFGFYLGLVGVAHLGFIDGILVRYGHYNYENLPKTKFRTFFFFLLFTQVIIAVILIGALILFTNNIDKKIIYIMVAINIIFVNIATFFSFVCQITKKFRIFAVNTMLQNVLNILFICILIFLGIKNYFYYIFIQSIINLLISIKYTIQFKDIVIGKRESIFLVKNEIVSNYKIGFFVLVGNFMGLIILGIDRIFIDRFLSIAEFSYYSFAVSLLGLVFTIINSISVYLYPYIARNRGQLNAQKYELFSSICILVASYSLCTFFVIEFIVINYLGDYTESIIITAILYPIIILGSTINIVSVNFYKALQLVKDYNRNNIVAFAITLLSNIIIVFSAPSLLNFSIGTFLSFYIWAIYTDFYFYRKFNINTLKHHIFIILTIASFFLCTNLSYVLGMFLYLLVVTVFVMLFYKDLLTTILKTVGMGVKTQ
ncbi:oligosaccharide flippase family protein [Geobacillus stearothermophilus]|uniref:oligosaccharide flippase family protein n=1 Tax=Geobacillus stearothermophilus TaxID=1422 RepID=UPI003D237583